LKIFTDQSIITQILHNLLINACKFSPESSDIIFEIIDHEKQIVINIVDTGIGIPVEDINSLFLPFFRCKNAGNIPGTGLGLAIVKHMSELIDSDISVKSELNKGSVFTLKIKRNNSL
jgi:signal transduction histidine kinase